MYQKKVMLLTSKHAGDRSSPITELLQDTGDLLLICDIGFQSEAH